MFRGIKIKVSTMMTPRSFLATIVWAVIVYNIGLSECAPTELSSTKVGAYPKATIASTMIIAAPSASNDAKTWSLQKSSSQGKQIIKSSLFKKTSKDKGGWAATRAGEKTIFSQTLASTGYDVEKNNLSRRKEPQSTTTMNSRSGFRFGSGSGSGGIAVDNINGPNDYTNKNNTNSFSAIEKHHQERQSSYISSNGTYTKKNIATNVNVDDVDTNDNNNNNDKVDTGKDIDFRSVSGKAKADKTYATASTTTERYHSKAQPTEGTTIEIMQSALMDSSDFSAKILKKSISSSSTTSAPILRLHSAYGKSIPMNVSVTPSLSLSFLQHPAKTTLSTATTTTTSLSPTPKLDVGHDGVKITKKKQLLDKHFIATSTPSGSMHSPLISKDNLWPLSKNKPVKSTGKKLMEVPNGYLGPIMMKEKTFSVTHHGKKPKSSILEQLKDKKLVEIIAPTALMEPTAKVKPTEMSFPEFVAIDSTTVTPKITTIKTTKTEDTSTVPTPTRSSSFESATATLATKEGKETETVTTYFVVVTPDASKSSSDKDMKSSEIKTTLKEIYTEVINAMDVAAKKSSHTGFGKFNDHIGSSIKVPLNIQSDSSQDIYKTPQSESNNQAHSSTVELNLVSLASNNEFYSTSDQSPTITLTSDKPATSDGNSISLTVSSSITPIFSTTTDRVLIQMTNDHRTTHDSELSSTAGVKLSTTTRSHKGSIAKSKSSSNSDQDKSFIAETTDTTPANNHRISTENPFMLSSTVNINPTSSSSIDQNVTKKISSNTENQSISLTADHVTKLLHVTKITNRTLTEPQSTPLPKKAQNSLVDLKTSKQVISTIDHLTATPISDRTFDAILSTPIPKIYKDTPSTEEVPSDIKINDRTSTEIHAILSPTEDELITDKHVSLTRNDSKNITSITNVKPQSVEQIIQPRIDDHTKTELSLPKVHYKLPGEPQVLNRDTDQFSAITDRTFTATQTTSFPKTDIKSFTGSKTTSHMSVTTDHSSTSSSFLHHDSSAEPTYKPVSLHQEDNFLTRNLITTMTIDSAPIFATITTDPHTSIAPLQFLKPTHDSEQTESKISDIQIEVYDSTVEPILAATNFKDNSNVLFPSSHVTPKDTNYPQERFTQYVVDKANDLPAQDLSSPSKAQGKPEPAAIEIHINVSEGFGNESEDLEFSYRQSDYRKVASKKPGSTNFVTLKPFEAVPQNETSNEAAEEIVVEIIDANNSNSTENSASRENLNINPIFTFRSDDDSQVELKNVKYYPEDRPKIDGPKSSDDFFVPQVIQQPPSANKPIIDRDSDTIFYISNTEVKVGESLPTTNSYDAQLKKSRLESQFFPANYEQRNKAIPQRYEEDIILSPAKDRISDPLKVVRRPLDISYVGESVMEVEQVTITTTISPTISTPDVIIQPAVLPEMAIGVPVIGELPPQIELKEIDFMPNFDGNREESSIQYGGDLIDEVGAMGVGFDMDSYPLGNMAMGMGQRSDAISSQILLNHRVNHLKKDELSADLAGSAENTYGSDLLRRYNDSVNGTVIGERIGNATAYSVMDQPPTSDGELHFTELHTLFTACFATLLPLVFSVVMAFGLRHLYRKYHTNPFNVMGHNSSTDPLDAEKGAGRDGDIGGVETPAELRASSLAFGATTDSANLENCSHSNEVNVGKLNDSVGRDCNGSVANGWAASCMENDCTQAITSTRISDKNQQENGMFIVNCNIEAQPKALATIPAQSSSADASVSDATITNKPEAASTAAPTLAPGTVQSNYSGANGSITTMTLKNNHLIVETEERNDISRDARETKMHYNNGEKDGVFVVEVSRGADSKIMTSSPVGDQLNKHPFNIDTAVKISDDKTLSNHEEVQVHPPPPESVSINDDMDSNHLQQIDEVDEFEDGPKFTKNSNTGLSQSDLSSTSSMDSNKRYSYGNQELYTIEQQDYTTPSPAATKAPHPHTKPQSPQPENHNDDNGHSENGHCLENDPPAAAPNNDSICPADIDSDVNGHSGVESKPKITAALLKQDTIIVNEMTNGLSHNGNDDDDSTPHQSMENLTNGLAPNNKTSSAVIDYGGDTTENGFDSIVSLPDPPSTEEIKQMNDIILMETNQLDSLPPPPPPGQENHNHHNGNGNADSDTENGDCLSVDMPASPLERTPTKAMLTPTITVVAPPLPSSATTTEIPHTNGNCMTGHTTTSSTAAVVEVSGSS